MTGTACGVAVSRAQIDARERSHTPCPPDKWGKQTLQSRLEQREEACTGSSWRKEEDLGLARAGDGKLKGGGLRVVKARPDTRHIKLRKTLHIVFDLILV